MFDIGGGRWIRAAGFCLVALGLTGPGIDPVRADETLRLHWDTCASTALNQPFTVQGPYRIVVTLEGFGEANRGHEILLGFHFNLDCGRLVPDAWRFDVAGCQAGRMAATPASTDPACPSMGASPTSYSIFSLELGHGVLRLGTTYDPFQPDAQSTYALWNVTFDHSMSVAGPTQGTQCGDADVAGCVQVMRGTWINPDMSEGLFLSGDPIQWENEFGCLFCDPAQPTTWGVLKALYR